MQLTTIVSPCISVVRTVNIVFTARPCRNGTFFCSQARQAACRWPGYRNTRDSRRETAGAAIDRAQTRSYTRRSAPVAQPVEHLTFNQGVVGSSPTGLAKEK